ncbi:MAG: tetratricopeptide repeat protein [Planctomycetota bacterium]
MSKGRSPLIEACVGVVAVLLPALVLAGISQPEQPADASTEMAETPRPEYDVADPAEARAFAIALLGGLDLDEADRNAKVYEIEASLDGYRAKGASASDVALIEAVIAIEKSEFARSVELAERAAEFASDDADVQYVLGTALINELSQGSFSLATARKAERAKKAWEEAVELKPSHIGARISLAMWHLQAPWIAGGRKGEAEKIGRSLIETGQSRWGRRILMMTSLKRERWKEGRDRLDALVATANTDEQRREAYITYLSPVLFEAERHRDAFDVLPAFAAVCADTDASPHYSYGRAYQARNKKGDRDLAINAYAKAVQTVPDARNSRWRLAELLRKADRDEEAAVHYSEFAARFPDHDDAKAAAKWAAKLND